MLIEVIHKIIESNGCKNTDDLYLDIINSLFNNFYNTDILINNLLIRDIIYLNIDNIKNKDVISIIEEINNYRLEHISINGKYIKNSFNKKLLGIFYTKEKISSNMVKKIINNFLQYSSNNIKNIKILDYCCGTGNFTISFIKYLNKTFGINIEEIINNNIYFTDIDKVSIQIVKLKLISLGYKNYKKLNSISFEGDNIFNDNNHIFKSMGINCIISNPPYLSLKINSQNNTDENMNIYIDKQKDDLKIKLNHIKKNNLYNYSNQGVLNLYKLSLENIISILPKNGIAEIICPSTLFGDITSSKLRKHIFDSGKICNIRYLRESEKTFEKVSQSLVIFDFIKSNITKNINVFHNNGNFDILYNDIKYIFNEKLEVPYIDKIGWKILKKLSKIPKLKHFKDIRNRRGELDQTLHKKYIIHEKSDYNFVRGVMLGKKEISYKNEYVLIKDFLSKKSNDYKKYDFGKHRITSKNIINIDNEKRINFVFCSTNDILGNSCNYISLTNNSKTELEKLQKILNSKIINWYFKIISSNNHLNNYEIDDFPIINYKDINNFEDKIICEYYGLNENEIEYILNY